jgi:ribosomal protein L40E
MGPQPSAPGASPPAPNSIQVSLDTEEKAGFFGSDRKSYPLWLNADEEVDAAMQPTIGLKDKVRNICTQAKITLPPPPPAPPQQPPAMLAPAPGYPPQPQQQPGAPLAAPPPVPAAPPQQPQAPPAPMQPTYQPPPQQYQAQAPPPAYQQQPAPQQWVAQPQPTQYGAPPAQQPQAQPQQWQQRICPNPNCQAPNAPNTVTCYRCGYRLQ